MSPTNPSILEFAQKVFSNTTEELDKLAKEGMKHTSEWTKEELQAMTVYLLSLVHVFGKGLEGIERELLKAIVFTSMPEEAQKLIKGLTKDADNVGNPEHN